MGNEQQKHELTEEEKLIIRKRHRLIYSKGTAINPVHGYEELYAKYPQEVYEYMKILNPNYSNCEFYKSKNA